MSVGRISAEDRRHILVWIGIAVLLGACYAPIIGSLWHQWLHDEYAAHGIFVPVIAGYIVWQRRAGLSRGRLKPSYAGLLVALIAAAILVVANLGAEIYLCRVSLLLSLAGAVITLYGWAGFRRLLLPFGLLLFMIPLPGIIYKQITFPLQLVSSALAASSLEILGHRVLREGNLILMANQTISVAEACSGLASLLSLAFFAFAYACLADGRVWVRCFLLMAAAPIAVFANSIRIVFTAIAFELDPQLAQDSFHASYGWIIFVISAFLIVGVHRLLILIPARKRASGISDVLMSSITSEKIPLANSRI